MTIEECNKILFIENLDIPLDKKKKMYCDLNYEDFRNKIIEACEYKINMLKGDLKLAEKNEEQSKIIDQMHKLAVKEIQVIYGKLLDILSKLTGESSLKLFLEYRLDFDIMLCYLKKDLKDDRDVKAVINKYKIELYLRIKKELLKKLNLNHLNLENQEEFINLSLDDYFEYLKNLKEKLLEYKEKDKSY